MSEILQKAMDKNYSKVQKKEIKLEEFSGKLISNYEKKVKELSTVLKDENKVQKAKDKEIKDEHKKVLKDIKDEYKVNTDAVSKKVKEANEKYSDEISKADSKNEKEVTKLNGLIERANNSYTKETEKVQKKYDSDVENGNNDLAKIEEKFQDDSAKLQEKFDERKAKYDEKVATLSEKRDTKIAKLNETSQKKIEKLLNDNDTQRAKTDKQLADLVPIYQEKLNEMEELIQEEKDEHDSKSGNIKSTLDSKVSRRNKFLEKAENENDSKAAKQQRKEIKQLQTNADRELKILAKAHEDRKKDLVAKKREVNKNNLEQIAAVEREYTNFKEDNLMQIELNKVSLSDTITKTKLDTELKLQDELSKFNDFEAKHAGQVGEVVKKKDLDVKDKEDELVKLEVEFDKENEINAAKLSEELANLEKGLQIAAFTKVHDYDLAKNKLDVALTKYQAEQDILDDKFATDNLVADESALLRYHRNDYDKQASVKAEFYNSQEALRLMMQERAQEVLAYEELEAENRANLKVKFLETQKSTLDGDFEKLKERIEYAYNQEEAYFRNEIEVLAAKDKDLLIEFTNGKEAEIQELVDEKKELDPQADKRRIRDLSETIEDKKAALTADIRQKEDAINVKIGIYQDNLDLATSRRNLALEEARKLYDMQSEDLANAINLVSNDKDAELSNARERQANTVANSNNFMNLATSRNSITTEENTKYLTDREDKENKIIDDAKVLFENNKNNTTIEKDHKLSDFETAKNDVIEKLKDETMEEERKQEEKAQEVSAMIAQSESKATQRLNTQAQNLTNAIREIDTALKQKEADTAADLRTKENRYKEAVAQIDKKADVEKKTYEAEQARVQKEFEIELKKSITNINSRLEADIKAL